MTVDKRKWYYLVRRGTNERHINKSSVVNVCERKHLPAILKRLNRFGDIWQPMTIARYEELFGELVSVNGAN